MKNLFLSYSRKDVDKAERIIADLSALGYRVWLDSDQLRGGDHWREKIVQAIETCDRFLILLSPNSVVSEHVTKELVLAETAQRTIIPLMIDDTELPAGFRYQLVGLQIISFAWDYEAGFKALLATLGDQRAGQSGQLSAAQPVVERSATFTPYPGDEVFNWRGHQITVRSELKGKYLYMASDTSVFVDGHLLGQAGGFTSRDVVDGSFKHRSQQQHLHCVCSQGNYYLSINGEVIRHGKVNTRHKAYGYLAAVVLLLVLTWMMFDVFLF